MANPKHLKILKQGLEAWHKLKEENTEVLPDLRGAILRGVNLCLAQQQNSCTIPPHVFLFHYADSRMDGLAKFGEKCHT